MKEMKPAHKKRVIPDKPLVSIIIPTFNSGETLTFCLESIKKQTYSNIETIVVDSYSQDDTRQIAEKFGAKLLLLASERCPARNLGAKNAHGDFVLFIDSDMKLTPKVVEECVDLSIRKYFHAVIIPEVSVGKGLLAECNRMEKKMRVGGKFSEAPRFFIKDVFHFVGGFDENLLSGEDFDLRKRIENAEYTVGRCNAKIIHCEGRLSLKKVVLKASYYGRSLPLFIKKNPSLATKTSCPIHIFRNFKLLGRHPINFIALIFMKFIQYMAYLSGIFSSFF